MVLQQGNATAGSDISASAFAGAEVGACWATGRQGVALLQPVGMVGTTEGLTCNGVLELFKILRTSASGCGGAGAGFATSRHVNTRIGCGDSRPVGRNMEMDRASQLIAT